MDSTIWTEKYRPKDFSEIKGQKEIVRRIKAFVDLQNIPHLLFTGPAGVGKTTLALVVAKKLFKDSWHQNFLELNASDERGIDIIRNKVKDFARTKAIGDVPFKIIYLDECLDYNTKIIVQSDDDIEEVTIGKFVENFESQNYKIMSVDDNGDMIYSKITKTVKLPFNVTQEYYKITIHDKEIIATGNHEFLTVNGWKRADNLKIKDLVLCPQTIPKINKLTPEKPVIYNLIGLPQEIKKKERYIANSPEKSIVELLGNHPEGLTREEITKKSTVISSKITSILSDKDNDYYLPLIKHRLVKKDSNKFKLVDNVSNSLHKLYNTKRLQNRSNQEYILAQLRSKELFPLKSDKSMICARILGHLFSDGCLSLKTKQLFFSGKEEDIRIIKKDINQLGYYGLGNIRHSRWKNGEVWSFGAYKIELLSLFYSLGAPVGKKTDNMVIIPDWIMNGDKSIQKEFLAALFGGDGYEPKFQGRTVKPIVIGISKREDLKKNLVEYLEQIKSLLTSFGIISKFKICPGIKSLRKDGTKTIEGRIWITNSSLNIHNFLTSIGYRYCEYKQKISKEVIRYLDWKKSLGKNVYSFRPVPYFKEWREKLKLGESAYHFVTSINKANNPDFVYCVSTDSRKFIANNIVVHNCDALTREAQQALRRTMENYTQTTRFILSANYSSKIIDPIQSRCAMFRFKPLEKKEIFAVIEKIEKDENIKINEKAKEALFNISEGDARKINNVLQSSAAISQDINEETIYSMASVAKPKEVDEALKLAINNKFIDARNKLMDIMLNYGLSGLDIIKQIQQEILNLDLANEKKMLLMEKCGEIEFRMTEGSDEFIQLEALLSQFVLYGAKK